MNKAMILTLTCLMGFSATFAAANENGKTKIDMFPRAQEGYVQYVIEVPKTDNDYAHKIALRIGKTILTDCNHQSFHGKVEEVSLKGWGYTYLEVSDIRTGVSTMMACSEPKTEKFISLQDTLRRYNSRLPLVVYVPQGYEVRYHIWSASKTEYQAQER